MRRFYFCAFFILTSLGLLWGCSHNVNHSDSDPFFLKIKGETASIIPGKSIGNLKVGEKTDSIQRLGKPQKGDAGMCKSLSRWFYGDSSIQNRKELAIFSECDPKDDMRPHVKWIRTTDPGFKTKSGIGVNSSFKEIKATFPILTPVASYISESDSTKQMIILNARGKGITFEIPAINNLPQKEGACQAVVIHDPDKRMPSLYFSFYKDLKILE